MTRFRPGGEREAYQKYRKIGTDRINRFARIIGEGSKNRLLLDFSQSVSMNIDKKLDRRLLKNESR